MSLERTAMIAVILTAPGCLTGAGNETNAERIESLFSYRELERTLYERPSLAAYDSESGAWFNTDTGEDFSTGLLERPGAVTFLENAGLLLGKVSPRIDQASRHIVSTADDIRPPTTKLMHAIGACASARWDIEGEYLLGAPLTGLFSKGTHVNGIVRISTANNTRDWQEFFARVPSLAIKLFPTGDPDEPVQTVNIVTFESEGSLDGTRSPWVLFDSPSGGPFYAGQPKNRMIYVNGILGTGLTSSAIARVFGLFVPDGRWQPVDHAGVVNGHGETVTVDRIRASRYVFFRARDDLRRVLPQNDFRKEILLYRDGEIVFEISVGGTLEGRQVIGTLTLGQPVVSDFCDLSLQFPHRQYAPLVSPVN